MGKYSAYRVGSPVVVKGNVSVIEELSEAEGGQNPFGFKVAGSADAQANEDIEPISLTDKILEHFGFKHDPITDFWEYDVKGHEVIVDVCGTCLVDGVRKEDIKNLHELKNLLHDECDGFVLRMFTGLS